MALTLTCEVPQIPLWVPAQAAEQLYELVYDAVHLILADLAGRISQRAPVGVSGNLAQSFVADPASATGGIEIVGGGVPEFNISGRVFSALPYGIVIDEGRRPGKPISREGIDAIGLWAQRKLGLSAGEADRAKWAIAYKIIQKGIEARHFVQAAFDEGQAEWQSMLDGLAEDIAAALVSQEGAIRAQARAAMNSRPRDSRGRFVKR